MTNEQKNAVLKFLFLKDDFQKKWKRYLKAFGKDLDKIFGDDSDKRFRLSTGLEHLLNKRYFDAYHEIRHFESSCVTDTDKQIFQRLIKLCLNEEEMARAKVDDWVKQSHGGYYQIVKHTPECAVIKCAFDHKFNFAKPSKQAGGFPIRLTDLKTYQFVEKEDLLKIENFFAENPDKKIDFLCQTDTILTLRDEILRSNFKEAEWDFKQFSFYRCTLEKVAFIVNLRDCGDHIKVIYGFTSIVDQNHLKNYGEDDDDIKVRFSSVIKTEQDKFTVANEVKSVYDTYVIKSKDEILNFKKERQKQFLQKIADKMKPLGFKKKGSKWTKELTDDLCLVFAAQKSQWTDVYYFNVSICRKDFSYPQCYDTRLYTNGKDTYNWQLMTDEELNNLLNEVIQNVLTPILNTPLAELGGNKDIWQHCACPRNKCDTCWVQKNLWEAIGEK